MNWPPGETGRNYLVKINQIVFKNHAMVGDQIKLNYTHNNKVSTIS